MTDQPANNSNLPAIPSAPDAEELDFDVVDDGRGAAGPGVDPDVDGMPSPGALPDADSLRQAVQTMLFEKTKKYVLSTLLIGGGLYWWSSEDPSWRWVFVLWCIWSVIKGGLLYVTWKITRRMGQAAGLSGIFFGGLR